VGNADIVAVVADCTEAIFVPDGMSAETPSDNAFPTSASVNWADGAVRVLEIVETLAVTVREEYLPQLRVKSSLLDAGSAFPENEPQSPVEGLPVVTNAALSTSRA
jgi:hypothetical protein